MKIMGLYAEDYPWDVRISKILGGLAGDGHDVHLVCRNLSGNEAVEVVDGIVCHRVGDRRLPGRLRSLSSIPAPFSPVWRSLANRIADELQPDLIIVRDVPLAPLALDLKRSKGIPVVVDMAENHPAMWRNVNARARWALPSKILKNPAVVEGYEHRLIREADFVFVVVEEMRDRLVALGAHPDRLEVISNTPNLTQWPQVERTVGRQGPVRIVFVGLLNSLRGVHTVIEAIKLVKDDVDIEFDVVGQGVYIPELKRRASECGISERVHFLGWMDHSTVPEILQRADMGIIPHHVTEHTNTTIPNKIFDYMAASLPVIVSDARPLARIVNDHGCGVVFRGEDPVDLARVFNNLPSPSQLVKMGENGRQSVEKRYHWAVDYGNLVKAITPLARHGT